MQAIAIEAALPSADRASAKATIGVRSLCLLSCRGETELLTRYLSPSEQERAARFRFRVDYERYVAASAALRLQLGRVLDCDPKSLFIQYTDHDKPFIEGCGIEFNLSHSGDWVLYALTRSGEIGIDIEHIRPMPYVRDVAQQNFSASEFAHWEATPDEDRTEAFYRCWTRKESFIKAIGEGLSCPLDSFEVTFGSHQSARLTSVNGDEVLAAEWWMADLPGFAGYAAAVTARIENPKNVHLAISQIEGSDLRDYRNIEGTF